MAAMTRVDPALLASWTAVGVTLLGVIVGLGAVWWQVRRQWLLHSAQLVTDLAQKFTSADLRSQRRALATSLLKHHQGDPQKLTGEIGPLIFFENIGYLVRCGALDVGMVWNNFSWTAVRYYLAMTNRTNLLHLARHAEKEPALYREFEWLFERMTVLYAKAGVNVRDPQLQEDWIKQLFDQETRL